MNLLNTLVGKENIEQEALLLLREYPNIIGVVPALLAERETKISLLTTPNNFVAKNFDFSKPMPAEEGLLFLKKKVVFLNWLLIEILNLFPIILLVLKLAWIQMVAKIAVVHLWKI